MLGRIKRLFKEDKYLSIELPLDGLGSVVQYYPEGEMKRVKMPVVVIYNVQQLAFEIAKALKEGAGHRCYKELTMGTTPSIEDEMKRAVHLGRLMLELIKLLHEQDSNALPETNAQQLRDCSKQ